MSAATHTPGSWEVTHDDGGLPETILAVGPAGDTLICTLESPPETIEGDAALIAAAPETAAERDRLRAENAALREALRWIADEYALAHDVGCQDTGRPRPPHASICATCECIRGARAALAAHAARTEGEGPRRGQANLPAVLAGLVLAVAAMWLVGWVGDHAATAAHSLACITRAIGG